MSRLYFAGALCALALTSGCATTMSDEAPAIGGLARLKANPDRISLTAASEGTLQVEQGCFKLRLRDGRLLSIIWPEGASLMQDGRGVQVDSTSFKAGDRVRLGGSAAERIPSTEVETIGVFDCGGPYFIASSVK